MDIRDANKEDVIKSFSDSDVIQSFSLSYLIYVKGDYFPSMTVFNIGKLLCDKSIFASMTSSDISISEPVLTSTIDLINKIIKSNISEVSNCIDIRITDPVQVEPTDKEIKRQNNNSIMDKKISLTHAIIVGVIIALVTFVLTYFFN